MLHQDPSVRVAEPSIQHQPTSSVHNTRSLTWVYALGDQFKEAACEEWGSSSLLRCSRSDALARQRDRCEERAVAAEAVLADEAYLFSPDVAGRRPWGPDGVSLAFRRLRKQVGLRDIRLHDLRHAAATQMLAAGIPVRTVAGRLGHANAATTLNVYGHWMQASAP